VDGGLPARAPGLALAAFDVDAVVHDPATDVVHLVEGLAAIVLGACDGVTPRAALVDDVGDVVGVTPAEAGRMVHAALAELAAAGLVTGTD
jgi:hypothetical protein